MNSGPQKSTIWALEGSRMLTALRRLWGQRSGGPRGVVDQSKARISAPSSPPPSRKEVPPGARLLAGGALGVMGERIAAGGKEARWQGGKEARRQGGKVARCPPPDLPSNNLPSQHNSQDDAERDDRHRQQGQPHREDEA